MQFDRNKTLFLLATGGTGGHVFPAVAVAEELIRQGQQLCLLVDERGSKYLTTYQHIPYKILPITRFTGSLTQKFRAYILLILAIWQVLAMMLGKKVKVIGFGGYPSLPALVAAILLNKPYWLHEQNAVIGKVNRLLFWRAQALFLTFKDSYKLPTFGRQKIQLTGLPLRQFIDGHNIAKSGSKLTLLVIGGSQAANWFAENILLVLAQLSVKMQQKWQVYLQVRPEHMAALSVEFNKLAVEVHLAPFFTPIAEYYQQADLVIARAGAATICELNYCKRPAILVPLPSAADNHQYYNAKNFIEQNAGWLVKQDKQAVNQLVDLLKQISKKPEILTAIQQKMVSYNTDAAHKIVQEIL
jgi:UDP-N-acetylglucosamine--N-acetylmuramyl-(pentapeptide) pyrophosphoryl-undecaprenol N-acetylglucosamine transferase